MPFHRLIRCSLSLKFWFCLILNPIPLILGSTWTKAKLPLTAQQTCSVIARRALGEILQINLDQICSASAQWLPSRLAIAWLALLGISSVSAQTALDYKQYWIRFKIFIHGFRALEVPNSTHFRWVRDKVQSPSRWLSEVSRKEHGFCFRIAILPRPGCLL